MKCVSAHGCRTSCIFFKWVIRPKNQEKEIPKWRWFADTYATEYKRRVAQSLFRWKSILISAAFVVVSGLQAYWTLVSIHSAPEKGFCVFPPVPGLENNANKDATFTSTQKRLFMYKIQTIHGHINWLRGRCSTSEKFRQWNGSYNVTRQCEQMTKTYFFQRIFMWTKQVPSTRLTFKQLLP